MKIVDLLHSTPWSEVESALNEHLLNCDSKTIQQYQRFHSSLQRMEPKECSMTYYIQPTYYDKVFECEVEMPRSFVITEIGKMSYYSTGYIFRAQALGMEIAEETLNRFSHAMIIAEILLTMISLGVNESTAIKRYNQFYADNPLVTE